ncbi:MAG: ADP-glyceromanno-heptose 6-epimerase [Rhodospirillales bacterium]|nr:ADP-glyceromanno-heptose 6-epimerase [Rhodospirillales bacterium]MSP79950.1 ADP-glyceromanno-heptose 6-epimerase [Rhodospirillales bacterium]
MYVVTGGAGFIGSNIVAALDARQPGAVLVCDRLGDGAKWLNLAKRELMDIVPPEELFAYLDRHPADIEAVIHMGAISSTAETDADRIVAANYRLSLALWRWCAQNQVRLIYASSAATYGDGAKGFDDDASPAALAALRPLNAYGWSKNLFDRRVARLLAGHEAAPPQWAGLKFFNVYGPNEYHKGAQKSVAVQIHAQIAEGRPARLFKSHRPGTADGGQMRDFIWVGDCVEIVLWLLDNPGVSGLFNCGTGQARSFADLAHAVFAALGKKSTIDYVPMPEPLRDKYQYFTEARTDRLRAAGYARPFVALEDGIARYVRDYLAAADPYR